MADFFNPATMPIPPAAQAIEDRRYAESRSQAKRKPLAPKPAPIAETEAEGSEEGQPEHKLDLDA